MRQKLTEATWLISISHFTSNHANWGKDLSNIILTEPIIFFNSTFLLITNACINTIITEVTWLIKTSHFKSNYANWGKNLPNMIFIEPTIFFNSISLNTNSCINTIITKTTWLISTSHFKRNLANWGKDLPNTIFTGPTIYFELTFSLITNSCINTIITEATWLI